MELLGEKTLSTSEGHNLWTSLSSEEVLKQLPLTDISPLLKGDEFPRCSPLQVAQRGEQGWIRKNPHPGMKNELPDPAEAALCHND